LFWAKPITSQPQASKGDKNITTSLLPSQLEKNPPIGEKNIPAEKI
jgi:hypothetical protein